MAENKGYKSSYVVFRSLSTCSSSRHEINHVKKKEKNLSLFFGQSRAWDFVRNLLCILCICYINILEQTRWSLTIWCHRPSGKQKNTVHFPLESKGDFTLSSIHVKEDSGLKKYKIQIITCWMHLFSCGGIGPFRWTNVKVWKHCNHNNSKMSFIFGFNCCERILLWSKVT